MNPMSTSTVSHALPHTERVRKIKDGSVLLSIAEDRICKLNGVGALTWMVIAGSSTPLTEDQIVCALQEQFAAVNSEKELHYEVPTEQLRTDTARFLKNLVRMKLLQVSRDGRGRESYSIREDVNATSTGVAAIRESQSSEEAASVEERITSSRSETISAFVALLAFDLLLKVAGFHSVIKRVERWPIAEPPRTDPEMCRRVRASVDRAQMYYPKKAMCLQHSAVVTCLLRRRGIPAEMVLAAQEFPPKAHAWAEVMNEVVSDSANVKMRYRELRRL